MCTQVGIVFIGPFSTRDNTRQCFYQSKTINSFWHVNVHVLTTSKVWQCATFKCTRYHILGKYIKIFTDFDPCRRVKHWSYGSKTEHYFIIFSSQVSSGLQATVVLALLRNPWFHFTNKITKITCNVIYKQNDL